MSMKRYERLVELLYYRVFTFPFTMLLIDSIWTAGGGDSIAIAIRRKCGRIDEQQTYNE